MTPPQVARDIATGLDSVHFLLDTIEPGSRRQAGNFLDNTRDTKSEKTVRETLALLWAQRDTIMAALTDEPQVVYVAVPARNFDREAREREGWEADRVEPITALLAPRIPAPVRLTLWQRIVAWWKAAGA
jgi:hypothetical protein